MEICKDLYEYILNFADDKTILNMLSVNKKFHTEDLFERTIKRKYPLLVECRNLDETWKQLFIRMTYYIGKLQEKYDIPYIFSKGYNPHYHYIYGKESIYEWSLTWAAFGGNLNIVKLMEKKILDENLNDIFERAMINAASGGYIEVIKYMISKGAKNFDHTMGEAAERGHTNVVDLLIKQGATDFNNALLRAAGGGEFEMVKYLINKGATNFSSAIAYATRENHLDIVKLLITKDIDFKYALDIARTRGYREIYNYLLSIS